MIRGRSSANDRDARREDIARSLMAEGARRIEDIAEEYGVSAMTIYRDIDYLSSQGVARRDRGYATALVASMSEVSTMIRMNQNVEIKKRLGSIAAKLVGGRDVVSVDESTSSIFAIDEMAELPPATIVTYSHTALAQARHLEGTNVIFCGGEYRPQVDACLGSTTVDQLTSLYCDLAIMSVTAIKDNVCLHADEKITEVKQAMISAAGRKVLIADRTKFGRSALHTVVPLSVFTDIVTEPGMVASLRESVGPDIQIHTF